MRATFLLCLVMAIGPLAIAQSSETARNAGFDKLSFEVEPAKKNYLPFEPLVLMFKVTNETPTPLAAEPPEFLLDSTLRVETPEGKVQEISGLSLNTGRPQQLPGPPTIVQPLQSYEEVAAPALSPDLLAEPGVYRLQFVLYGGKTPIESNVIEVIIEAPQGADEGAFSYLSKTGKSVWFDAIYQDKNGVASLIMFVEQYGASVYGEYAIASLGNYYRSVGEIDKAVAEYEKIRFSDNKLIARIADHSLAAIEEKRKDSPEQLR